MSVVFLLCSFFIYYANGAETLTTTGLSRRPKISPHYWEASTPLTSAGSSADRRVGAVQKRLDVESARALAGARQATKGIETKRRAIRKVSSFGESSSQSERHSARARARARTQIAYEQAERKYAEYIEGLHERELAYADGLFSDDELLGRGSSRDELEQLVNSPDAFASGVRDMVAQAHAGVRHKRSVKRASERQKRASRSTYNDLEDYGFSEDYLNQLTMADKLHMLMQLESMYDTRGDRREPLQ
jgi:hypothetical protein